MIVANLNVKKEAFPYQLDAVEAIKNGEYSAVFHEQGLGKTKIAIDAMFHWLENGDVKSVIVVAKRNLIPNWLAEFSEHTFIIPKILSSSSKDNFYVFNSGSKIIVGHYEAIKKEKERIRLYCEGRDVGIILDESHKIKNPNSAISQAFIDIRGMFKRRMILTGTPSANRPYDIWNQIFFLDGGDSLGTDYDTFRRETDIDFVAEGGSEEDYEKNLINIMNKVGSFSVRETKNSGVINLPGKVVTRLEAEWEKLQFEKYVEVRDELRLILIKDGVPVEDDASPILKRLVRLVQIASNPRLIDEGYAAVPGKVHTLLEVASQIVDRGEKAIIWSSFNDNMGYLKNYLSEFGCRTVFGPMSIEDRYVSIDAFKNDPNVRILLATPGAAKEGLTLTVANNVIYFDRTFRLDDYLQSQDRIHRISQDKTCNIYNIIMEGSIDEWVDNLITAKTMAAKLAQGDIDQDEFRQKMIFDFQESLRAILAGGSNHGEEW